MKQRSILVFAFACALVALPVAAHAAEDHPGALDTIGNGAESVSQSAKGAAETVGESAEGAAGTVVGTTKDAYLVTTVKSKLAASDKTSAIAINVDAADGVVTLSGTVPTEDAKDAAEDVASGVDGVSSVKNDLKVSATATDEEED